MKKLIYILLFFTTCIIAQVDNNTVYPNVVRMTFNRAGGFLQLPDYTHFNPIKWGVYVDTQYVYLSQSNVYGDVDTINFNRIKNNQYFRAYKNYYPDSSTSGFFIGVKNNTPQFIIGDKNSYLRWAGDSIQIKGNFTVKSKSIDSIKNIVTTHATEIADNAYNITLTAASIASLAGKVTTDSARITVNADSINIKVSQWAYNGAVMASYINLTPSTIKISSPHIDFNGPAMFKALNGTGDSTVILGSLLKTGTVIADSIRSTYLYSKTLVGGSITGAAITGGNISISSGIENISISSAQIAFLQSAVQQAMLAWNNTLHSLFVSTPKMTVDGVMQANSDIYGFGNLTVTGNINSTWAGSIIGATYLPESGWGSKSSTIGNTTTGVALFTRSYTDKNGVSVDVVVKN